MIDPKDIKGLKRKLNTMARRINKEVDVSLQDWAIGIHKEIIRLIRSKSPGVRVNKGVGTHVISKPGYPPNWDTGQLAKSYQFKIEDIGNMTKATVGSRLNYAAYLEFGTNKMGPRPHLKPAYEKITEKIEKRLISRVEKILKNL
jgi:HK97 gp10 family phage protein